MIQRRLTSSILAALIAISSAVFIQPARAESQIPTVRVVAPASDYVFKLDTPQEVTLRITGGFASNANSCAFPQKNTGERQVNVIIQIEDEKGNKLFWRDPKFFESFASTYGARSKVIPEGIECTISFNEPNTKSWQQGFYSNVEISSLIKRNANEDFNFGNPIAIKFIPFVNDWPGPDSVSVYPGNEVNFKASPGIKPKLTFLKISRGTTVDRILEYQVRLEVKEGLTPVSIYGPDTCAKFSLSETKNGASIFLATCKTSVGFRTRRTVQLGTYTVQAAVKLSNNETVDSEILVLNIGSTDFPIATVYASQSVNAKGLIVTFKGSSSRILELGDEVNLPLLPFKICIAGQCKDGVTSNTGVLGMNFDFDSSELKKLQSIGTEIDWEFSAQWNGISVIDRNQLANLLVTSPIYPNKNIDGQVDIPAPPVKEIKPTVGMRFSNVPNKVKWGNFIKFRFTASGKGKVLCAAFYQPTVSDGIVTFYATAGKSGVVSIKPWFYKLASYPLQVACSSLQGGGLDPGEPRSTWTLGNVTITN